MGDYYYCFLVLHVKASLNVKIVHLQHDAALFEESDFMTQSDFPQVMKAPSQKWKLL